MLVEATKPNWVESKTKRFFQRDPNRLSVSYLLNKISLELKTYSGEWRERFSVPDGAQSREDKEVYANAHQQNCFCNAELRLRKPKLSRHLLRIASHFNLIINKLFLNVKLIQNPQFTAATRAYGHRGWTRYSLADYEWWRWHRAGWNGDVLAVRKKQLRHI